MPGEIDSDDEGLGLESIIFDALANHTKFRAGIVAGVTVTLVLASLVEDECVGMRRLPRVPGRVGKWKQFKGSFPSEGL